jgi:hypothetical protein
MPRYSIDTDQRTVTEEPGQTKHGGLAGLAVVVVAWIVWTVIKGVVEWFGALWHQALEFTRWLIHTVVILGLEGSFIIACILAVFTVVMRVFAGKTGTQWRGWALGMAGFTLVPIVFLCYAHWLDHLERTSFVGPFTVGHAALSGIGVALATTLVSVWWDKK